MNGETSWKNLSLFGEVFGVFWGGIWGGIKNIPPHCFSLISSGFQYDLGRECSLSAHPFNICTDEQKERC